MLGVNCYRVSSPLLSRKVSTAKVIGCLYFQFNPCLYQQSRQQHDDQREEQRLQQSRHSAAQGGRVIPSGHLLQGIPGIGHDVARQRGRAGRFQQVEPARFAPDIGQPVETTEEGEEHGQAVEQPGRCGLYL